MLAFETWTVRSRTREYARAAELVFADRAALDDALASPEFQAVAADAERLEREHGVRSFSQVAVRDEPRPATP
jgi:hypothetical protein